MTKRIDPQMSLVHKNEIGPMSARSILAEAPRLVRDAVKRGWMSYPSEKNSLRDAEIRRILHGDLD